ncbi:Glycosylphosphatidylinositol anchor attachment 1 protein [Halotydeus destructor]|nr:Glycosylphosphatidylinositol anchor attachment 1 protein [Halotydeus destructor]
MGLLTSDKANDFNFIADRVTKYGKPLACGLFLSGLVTFGLLVSEQYCDKTYFSDNALLPGLVHREFTLGALSDQLHESLVKETSNYHGQIPYPWLTAQFRQLGLEVYTQNFTLNYPFGSKTKFHGRNVYAILRAPRAPSTESLVLSTPFRDGNSAHGSTLPGVALMIALANYFSRKTYWAKDIVFLISDHELVGVQAWLNAFHDMEDSNILKSGDLEARTGPIQAAINLEIHSTMSSRLEIKIEGLNGQLPNLDLFNVAVELATRESVTPTFHGESHPYVGDQLETWKQYAITTGSMMISQGITLPTGAHGLFQKFAIQALTLEAIERRSSGRDSSSVPVTLLQLGRVIEGVFRSLNNLLEKFNRSYWFYLLPSTRRYVSIGFYMIAFGLMAVPLLLLALQIYFSWKPEGAADRTYLRSTIPLLSAIPTVFVAHALGLSFLTIPYLIEHYQDVISQNWETKDLLFFTLMTMSATTGLIPIVNRRSSQAKLKARLCVAFLNLALLLSSVSLVNISLAVGLTAIYVPVVALLSVRNVEMTLFQRSKKLAEFALLLLLHPLVIHFLCLLALTIYHDYNQSVLTLLTRSYDAQKKVILYYVEDWYIYGNWTYFFATAFLFPVWFQFWTVI